LESCKPSKKLSFLMVIAGKAGNHHQKNGDLGRRHLPKPHHPDILCYEQN
jgi:hypothetical protein